MREKNVLRLVLVTMVLSIFTLGCVVTVGEGRVQTQREVIQREGVDSAKVDLKMGAGRLEIRSGSPELMEGEFTYNDRGYAPMIDYTVVGSGAGELFIEQEEISSFNLRTDYRLEWDLNFNSAVPLDLYVSLGAGEVYLDASGLNLTSLEMDLGAGEATLILPELVAQDFKVSIQGGVGQLNVEIPEGTCVYAEIAGGLGDLEVHGMMQEGNAYRTPDCSDGPAVHLDIEGGVGEVNLSVE